MSQVVRASVNGQATEFLCGASDTALTILRDTLGLTGTKEGCGTGDCGACTILLNDQPVCACLVLGPELDGARVVTIEGIASGGRLHPIQRALIDCAGFQCGICTPGIVVAAKALLARNPSPDEREIRLWLAGNLCRCTGYDKIVRSILHAAARMRDGAEG